MAASWNGANFRIRRSFRRRLAVGAARNPRQIAVDPKTGGLVAYAKFPPGYVFPQHWHSHTEYTVLLSGKASFTLDGKTHELIPGSYVVIPAKAHDSVTCGQDSRAPRGTDRLSFRR